MLKYLIKKVIIMIPAIFLLAVIVFFLSKLAPGDRVLSYWDLKGSSISGDKTISKKDYKETAHELYLDLPLFYFSIHPKLYPDSLHKIVFADQKDSLKSILLSNATASDMLPVISFYGNENQFQKWFGNILKLDFGISSIDGQKTINKIGSALRWTSLYIVIAYILTYGFAIFIGIFSIFYRKKKFIRILEIKMMILYAIPLFWLATLAVIFFTSSEITPFLNIFPSIGIGEIYSDMSFSKQISIAIPHLILPSIVIAIHSGAYLSTLLKKNMEKEISKKYYTTLLSRGLSKKNVILKHIFPNSMLPLTTMIIVSLPASFAGSVVMEVIFNIPGMGRLLYDSILGYDWNVVFAIVLLLGVFTYISYLIGDMVYSYLNPKIQSWQ
jgi:peptide/nickel transport system permease protein